VVQDIPRKHVVLQTQRKCRFLQTAWNILTSGNNTFIQKMIILQKIICNLQALENNFNLKWRNGSRLERGQIAADKIIGYNEVKGLRNKVWIHEFMFRSCIIIRVRDKKYYIACFCIPFSGHIYRIHKFKNKKCPIPVLQIHTVFLFCIVRSPLFIGIFWLTQIV